MRRIFLTLFLCLLLQGSGFVIDATQNAAEHNNNGVICFKDKEYGAAINEFKIAIALTPNEPATATYFNNLGLVYREIRRYDWAQESFERAIQINPNFFEYYKNLISTYRAKRTLADNLAKYKKIIKRDNLNSIAWLFTGLIYAEMGQINKAVECFKVYISIEPDMLLTEAVKKYVYDIKQEENL